MRGAYLGKRLESLLGHHPNVGDIRGRGLFWGLEFVQDKGTKKPFNPKLGITQRLCDRALVAFNMTVYPGTGTVDGITGDHIILAPTYITTEEDVEYIANILTGAVEQVFRELGFGI